MQLRYPVGETLRWQHRNARSYARQGVVIVVDERYRVVPETGEAVKNILGSAIPLETDAVLPAAIGGATVMSRRAMHDPFRRNLTGDDLAVSGGSSPRAPSVRLPAMRLRIVRIEAKTSDHRPDVTAISIEIFRPLQMARRHELQLSIAPAHD